MTAAAMLLTLREAGAVVRVEDGQVVVRAPPGVLSPLAVGELRDRKAAVLSLLTGVQCWHCEGPIDWARPAVPFADGTAVHLGCYEEADEARLQAAGERAVRGVIATSDEGELIVEGEP